MNYRLYGFSVNSEIPLPADQVAEPEAGDLLEIKYGGVVSVPHRPGEGRVIACVEYSDNRGFALSCSPDGYLLRFFGLCEFEISHDLRRLIAHHDRSRGEEWLQAFLAANVFGFVLALMEQPALHASAVAFQQGVIAVAGGSGAGKSTLAALMCAAGGGLVTDDLLRLRFCSDKAQCFTGSRLLRLKGAAAELAFGFPQGSHVTVDERVAVEFGCPAAPLTMAAVVLPRISNTASSLKLEPLSEKDAFVSLVGSSYLAAWKDPRRPRAHFRCAAQLVRSVPVYSAEIPWGPPFSPEIAGRLQGLAKRR